MNKQGALVCSLVALFAAAVLLRLSYWLISSGVKGDEFRDLWNGGIYGLVVGFWGLGALAGGIGAMYTAITGRELPEPTAPARTYATSGGSAEIDDADCDEG